MGQCIIKAFASSLLVITNTGILAHTHGIGRTLPAVDRPRLVPLCTGLCIVSVHSGTTLTMGMQSQNRSFGTFSIITNAFNYFAWYLRCIQVVPQCTETVHKRTEMVRKRCKYGIRLQQAGSVLCRVYGPFSLRNSENIG